MKPEYGARDYRHLPEVTPGVEIDLSVYRITKDGTFVVLNEPGIIGETLGGGFYGATFELTLSSQQPPKEAVIKTSAPGVARSLIRSINWDLYPFAPGAFELAARHDYLTSLLIHKTVGKYTDGVMVTPEPMGYAPTKRGWVQLKERFYGRSPRFDLPENEVSLFRSAQRHLLIYASSHGLEQMAQIHPQNRFGMENLWWNPELNHWEWVDDLPAIRHTEYVFPWFWFPFHKDIQKRVNVPEVTFNQIHTDTFRTGLEKHTSKYSQAEREELNTLLDLYGENRRNLGELLDQSRITQTITSWYERGKISQEEASRLSNSKAKFYTELSKEGIKTGAKAVFDLVGRVVSIDLRPLVGLLILNDDVIKEQLLLKPIKALHKRRLITNLEAQQAIGILFQMISIRTFALPDYYSLQANSITFRNSSPTASL